MQMQVIPLTVPAATYVTNVFDDLVQLVEGSVTADSTVRARVLQELASARTQINAASASDRAAVAAFLAANAGKLGLSSAGGPPAQQSMAFANATEECSCSADGDAGARFEACNAQLSGFLNGVLIRSLAAAGVIIAAAIIFYALIYGVEAARRAVPDRLVETMLAAGYVPVLATAAPLAPGEDAASDHFYNVNADQAAGPLAAALHADALLFLSDVPGVLDGDKRRLDVLTPARAADLRGRGVIAGGMIPKVDAALQALASTPAGTLVKIASATGDDAILAALSRANGTTFALA